MSAVSFKCPNCGGDLRFDPKTQTYKCQYCASSFNQGELDKANPQAAESADAPVEKTDEKGAVVYSCPSCGGEIVTDDTTAATFCYYCHNPVVLKGKLSGEYQPDMVIPFAVDRKEAVESFLEYVKSKRFVPRDFFCKEQIEKISGVYFPFWMYSCKADGEWSGGGSKVRVFIRGDMEITETEVYEINREGELDFKRLTRNALNKENKQLVEAVQPFQLEEAKDFSMGYLSGFLAEKRDIEKQQLLSELREEVKNYGSSMLKGSVEGGYTSLKATKETVNIRGEEWKYLLLPVWVLTYRGGDGKTYYYAMNGQTKKVCGVLPVSKNSIRALFLAIVLPLMILLLMGGYFLW